MKRTHLFGTMMACTLAAVVSVGAQERPSTSPSDREAKTVVVTGCLKSAPASSTAATPSTTGTAGTAGTAGSTASSARGSFILTDAVVSSDTASTAGATSTPPTGSTTPTGATTGTSGSSASAGKTYSVVGGQQSELQGFLNSKVESRGTLNPSADRSAAGAGSTAGTPPTTTPPTTTPPSGTGSTMSGMAHGEGQLRVTSVKQIAGSCSGQ